MNIGEDESSQLRRKTVHGTGAAPVAKCARRESLGWVTPLGLEISFACRLHGISSDSAPCSASSDRTTSSCSAMTSQTPARRHSARSMSCSAFCFWERQFDSQSCPVNRLQLQGEPSQPPLHIAAGRLDRSLRSRLALTRSVAGTGSSMIHSACTVTLPRPTDRLPISHVAPHGVLRG